MICDEGSVEHGLDGSYDPRASRYTAMRLSVGDGCIFNRLIFQITVLIFINHNEGHNLVSGDCYCYYCCS